MGRISIVDEYI